MTERATVASIDPRLATVLTKINLALYVDTLSLIFSELKVVDAAITLVWTSYSAVKTVGVLADPIDALVIGSIKPVVLDTGITCLWMPLADVALAHLARRVKTLLLLFIKVVAIFAPVTAKDARD